MTLRCYVDSDDRFRAEAGIERRTDVTVDLDH